MLVSVLIWWVAVALALVFVQVLVRMLPFVFVVVFVFADFGMLVFAGVRGCVCV